MTADRSTGEPDTLHPTPPAVIRIGHLRYTVTVDTARCQLASSEGLSHGNEQTIIVRDDRPWDSASETLLHEVLHQCLHAAGLEASTLSGDGNDIEERVVRAMSGMLIATLRGNPDLTAYLLREEPVSG